MTRSPSVTGEAEPYGLVLCVRSAVFTCTPACQSCFPVLLSKQSKPRFLSAANGCVTNTRSPQTIGVEFPGSGKGARQRTLFVAFHFVGKLMLAETPFPFGPRHAGQFSPRPETAALNDAKIPRYNFHFIPEVTPTTSPIPRQKFASLSVKLIAGIESKQNALPKVRQHSTRLNAPEFSNVRVWLFP